MSGPRSPSVGPSCRLASPEPRRGARLGWVAFAAKFHLSAPSLSMEPVIGALFGLYRWHNAKAPIAGGTGPYFCLPLDGHGQAALWSGAFVKPSSSTSAAARSHSTTP